MALMEQPEEQATMRGYNSVESTSGPSGIMADLSGRVIPEPPCYMLVTVTLLYIVIFVTGIIGNSLVIVVLWRNQAMRSYTNCLLGNLSIADLLVILVCMPTAVLDLHAKEVWYLGSAMCRMVPFLENTVATSSVITILVISLERYHAICRPLQTHTAAWTVRRMLKICFAIWIVSLLACAPFLEITVHKKSSFLDGTPILVCRTYIRTIWQKTYIYVLYVFTFLLPMITFAMFYALIARRLLNSTNKRQQNRCGVNLLIHTHYCRPRRHLSSECTSSRDDASSQLHAFSKRRQGAVIVLIVVALFFVFLMPMHVVRVVSVANPQLLINLGYEGYFNVVYFARVMFYLNSIVNPICYNALSTKFRQAFVTACDTRDSRMPNSRCSRERTSGVGQMESMSMLRRHEGARTNPHNDVERVVVVLDGNNIILDNLEHKTTKRGSSV